MCLVASSSPPFSPPPPCGDEKEEDSAEEEEADGGGGAPRDLGSAGTGRGGPGTAPLELRVLGNSPRRTRSAARRFCALLWAWAQARPLALAPTFLSSPHPSSHRDPAARKGNFPHPPRGPAEPPKPTPQSGAGTPSEEEISRGFSFSSPVSPKELKMAENVVEPGPPSAKRPKLSSPALSASASDGTG